MERHFDCCIAGGGPAGMMLGTLLARRGASVAVLEKHKDFLRDFRGDTIHPSTMQVLEELGWLDDLLKLPHQPVSHLTANFDDRPFRIADLSHLPVKAPFIAMMPQWDFLNFLAERGRAYPAFSLFMETRAIDLVRTGERITGVKAVGPEGERIMRAGLVIAADGRSSTLRACAGLESEEIGAPMDVLWFRLPRLPSDTAETQARFHRGSVFVMLNRGAYWQCAFVIAKGNDARIRAEGLAAFRDRVGKLVPFEAERSQAIAGLDDVKLLTVQIDRLKQWWRPGFLCIGDAAHAMSPVGGVGINLAIQDAVAAANILADAVREGEVTDAQLAAVQKRREWPTRMTQRLQVLMQNAIIVPALANKAVKPPLAIRAFACLPILARIPARLLGMGFRPEHIKQ